MPGHDEQGNTKPVPVIYYIRHGETAWNVEGRLQGAQDIPLNDLGRRQAAQAGKILADLFARDGRDKSSLAFVASPLVPCKVDDGTGARRAGTRARGLRARRPVA